jgi:chemotaxis response regulator CheB
MHQVSLTRRALLAAGAVALLGWTSSGRLAEQRLRPTSPDDVIVDVALAQKQALLTVLAALPDSAGLALVAAQQRSHIEALMRLRTRNVTPTAAAPAITSELTTQLQRMSEARLEQSLSAENPELARLLVLIAASERVHAEVTR